MWVITLSFTGGCLLLSARALLVRRREQILHDWKAVLALAPGVADLPHELAEPSGVRARGAGYALRRALESKTNGFLERFMNILDSALPTRTSPDMSVVLRSIALEMSAADPMQPPHARAFRGELGKELGETRKRLCRELPTFRIALPWVTQRAQVRVCGLPTDEPSVSN